MSSQVLLTLGRHVQEALWRHLLPPGRGPEEAAFVFAMPEPHDGDMVFQAIEWYAVPPDGFESRSSVHFELTDAVRARVIKRAHDLGSSLVEFHSHTGPWPAEFSPSDVTGFREFVPHIWWRLKGRPYLAVVVTRTGFDGFAWLTGPNAPVPLAGIVEHRGFRESTGRSRWELDSDEY